MSKPRRQWLKYIPLLLCVLTALALLLIFGKQGMPSVEQLAAQLSENTPIALAAVLFLYLIKGVSGVVLYGVVAALAGLLFPLPIAILVNVVGTAMSVSVSYFVGRFARSERMRQRIEERLSKNEKLQKYLSMNIGMVPLCLLLRVLGLQSEILGLFFGSMGMKYLPFLLCSLAGMMTALLQYTLLGDTASFLSVPFLVATAVDVCLLGAAFAYATHRVKKSKETEASEEKHPSH